MEAFVLLSQINNSTGMNLSMHSQIVVRIQSASFNKCSKCNTGKLNDWVGGW